MAWESEYVNYGVLIPEGNKVKVYKDQYNYITVDVDKTITNANWAGGGLDITMSDGYARRYSDQYNYETIH